MHNVMLLTRLELKQTLGGFQSAISSKTGMSEKASTVGTAILCIALFAFTVWVGHSSYATLGAVGQQRSFFEILFLATGLFTFVFSLPTVLGSFFGSSDINDLLPLPVSETSIAFSKATGALGASYVWTALFLAGPLLGWGITAGGSIIYWVTYVVAIVCAPMMPVAYSGILSILVAKVFKRARRKDTITTIAMVFTLLISVGVYLAFRAVQSSDLASAIGSLANVMGGAVMAFPSYGFAVYALQYDDPLSIVLFIAVSVAAFAIFVLVARVLYLRIVTSLSSGGARTSAYHGAGTAKTSSAFISLVLTDIRRLLRTSTLLFTYVVYPIVVTPIIVAFLSNSDSLHDTLTKLAETGGADILLAGFLLTAISFFIALDAATNKIAATAISREGSNWMYMKYVPVPLITQLRAKVCSGYLVNVVITLVISCVAGVTLIAAAGISPILLVWNTLLMLGSCWLMSCIGTLTDARGPRVNWGCDGDVNTKVVGGNAGVMRSILIGFVYAALPLLVSPLVRLDPFVFMPIIAIVGIAVAVVLGELCLRAAARNLQAFE